MSVETKHAHLLVQYLDLIYKKYKHVAVKIESYWGTELGHKYLKYLLVLDRERQGFDFNTFIVLMALYVIHTKQFGNFDDPVMLDELNLNVDSINNHDKLSI